jgi:hypothetical protein
MRIVGPAANESIAAARIDDVTGVPAYAQGLNLLKRFDSTRGIWNYLGPNTRRLDQSIGDAAAGGHSHHIWIGDSVSAGALSSTGFLAYDRLRSIPLVFRDTLAQMGVPANGTGFVRIVDSTAALDARWTPNGAWTNSATFASTSTVGNAAILTADRPGTIFELGYEGSRTGTFTVSIDGATSGAGFTTFTPAGTAGWFMLKMTGITIKVGSTIKITLTVAGTGNAGMALSGASVWTPGKGIIMHNLAQSGSRAQGTGNTSWSDTAAGTPYDVLKGVAGSKRTITDAATTAGNATLTSATAAFTAADVGLAINQFPDATGPLFPNNTYIKTYVSATQVTMSANAQVTATAKTLDIGRDPACVHIALGGNDLIQGLNIANIAPAITAIRNHWPNSDCILHLENEPSTTVVTSANDLLYQVAMYQLARDLDLPLYDWRDRSGSFATAYSNGMMGDTTAHMTTGSYESIGASLAWIVGGAAGRPQSWPAPVDDGDLTNKAYVDAATINRRAKTSTATATTTVESVVLSLKIKAGTLAVGDVIRYAAWLTPAATTITTVRVRIGATGTTTDAAVQVMSATAATNAGARYAEGEVGIAVIGGSATFIGGGTETVGAISAAGTSTAATGTFNSTVDNFVTVTVQNTTSTTTTVRAGSLELV